MHAKTWFAASPQEQNLKRQQLLLNDELQYMRQRNAAQRDIQRKVGELQRLEMKLALTTPRPLGRTGSLYRPDTGLGAGYVAPMPRQQVMPPRSLPIRTGVMPAPMPQVIAPRHSAPDPGVMREAARIQALDLAVQQQRLSNSAAIKEGELEAERRRGAAVQRARLQEEAQAREAELVHEQRQAAAIAARRRDEAFRQQQTLTPPIARPAHRKAKSAGAIFLITPAQEAEPRFSSPYSVIEDEHQYYRPQSRSAPTSPRMRPRVLSSNLKPMTPMTPLADLQSERQQRALDEARYRGAEAELRRQLDDANRRLAERDAQEESPPFGHAPTPPSFVRHSFSDYPSVPTHSPGGVYAPTPRTEGVSTPYFRDDLAVPGERYREQHPSTYIPRAEPRPYLTPQPGQAILEDDGEYDTPLFDVPPDLRRAHSNSAPSSRRRAPSPMMW